ncbi:hypothetical protein ACFXA3_36555, partial [Streptomyces sp. NPDC059456]
PRAPRRGGGAPRPRGGGGFSAPTGGGGVCCVTPPTATPPAVTTITLDQASGAIGLALTPAGDQAYVTNVDSGNVLAINTTAQPPAVSQTIAGGGAPVGVAVATVPDTSAQTAALSVQLVPAGEEGATGLSGKTSTTGGAPGASPRLEFSVIGSNSGFVPLARSRSLRALIEHPVDAVVTPAEGATCERRRPRVTWCTSRKIPKAVGASEVIAGIVIPAPARVVPGNPPGAVAPQRSLEALSVHVFTDDTPVRGHDTFVLIERVG